MTPAEEAQAIAAVSASLLERLVALDGFVFFVDKFLDAEIAKAELILHDPKRDEAELRAAQQRILALCEAKNWPGEQLKMLRNVLARK